MPDPRGAAGPEDTLLANLPFIERVARKVCRRGHLSTQDAEDFESALKLKLVADDYAVLRKFKDRSRLSTYLCAVTKHYFLDYLDHLWGRWRPSAAAQKLGAVAVKLERLLTADGLSLAEAFEVLRTNHKVDLTTEELEELAAQLPAKNARRFTSDEALVTIPAAGADADALVEESEQERLRGRVEGALAVALKELPDQDRLIVRMSVQDGMTAAAIARALHLDPKGIYRRLEQIHATLRKSLEGQGVQSGDVTRLLGDGPSGDDGSASIRRPKAV